MRRGPVSQTSLKCDTLNFWALTANSSKAVKATDIKFDTRVYGVSPDVNPYNFSKRGRGQGHVTPQIFGALNANSSKTVKATSIKFDTRVFTVTPNMSP